MWPHAYQIVHMEKKCHITKLYLRVQFLEDLQAFNSLLSFYSTYSLLKYLGIGLCYKFQLETYIPFMAHHITIFKFL